MVDIYLGVGKKTKLNYWTEPNQTKKTWTITNSSETELKQFSSK